MFDQELWRTRITERLSAFARNPRQEIQIAGNTSLLSYLGVRALEPFVEAFQHTPVAAVLSLAEITRGPGADQIVRRVSQMRYQVVMIIEREIRISPEMRAAIEQILIALDVVHIARQRLNSSRDEWFRLTLLSELQGFGVDEFSQLRKLLQDTAWQSRYEMIRSLRARQGRYTAADLVLLHDGLGDSASHVRAAAARMLGQFADTPPAPLVNALTKVALYDCDLETRYAAARTLGALRDRIASPQLIDHLEQCLTEEDGFVRSAAALVLSQLGELAGVPSLVVKLANLMNDPDPYTREAVALALGRIGLTAATPHVINVLTQAMQDSDANVHEAAVDALTRLRKLRATTPLPPNRHPTEPLALSK